MSERSNMITVIVVFTFTVILGGDYRPPKRY